MTNIYNFDEIPTVSSEQMLDIDSYLPTYQNLKSNIRIYSL